MSARSPVLDAGVECHGSHYVDVPCQDMTQIGTMPTPCPDIKCEWLQPIVQDVNHMIGHRPKHRAASTSSETSMSQKWSRLSYSKAPSFWKRIWFSRSWWCLEVFDVPAIWTVVYRRTRNTGNGSPAGTTSGQFCSETEPGWRSCQYLSGSVWDMPQSYMWSVYATRWSRGESNLQWRWISTPLVPIVFLWTSQYISTWWGIHCQLFCHYEPMPVNCKDWIEWIIVSWTGHLYELTWLWTVWSKLKSHDRGDASTCASR